MAAHRTITPTTARRLAITRQRLSGKPPKATPENILQVVRDLGCVQIDPISAVARTQYLVMWSRMGQYRLIDFERHLWWDHNLFEYWAHAASIVLTEDYPIHYDMMRHYGTRESAWGQRSRQWIQDNQDLYQHILTEIEANGPLASKNFSDKSQGDWHSTGWTSGRNVNQMLDYLWSEGKIMIAGRSGLNRVWDLSERCLPEWTPREVLDRREVVRRATQKSLRALGVGTTNHIKWHYTRHRYPGLPDVLKELEAEGRIERVKIADDIKAWPGVWYIHADDLPLLEQIEAGDWQPRTVLLSPFDNLICDRGRTELMFNYEFRIEIYVPEAKRQYGYYVLSILHGDRLIGRIDPKMNRKTGQLEINNVYAEPGAPLNKTTGRAIAKTIDDLAAFLEAKSVTYNGAIPDGWKSALG
ncbi:MAG: winged helix DNA-binding domain-containing protein [Anaerolineae bacterium]|nr:winged helix DNA-binding domain-containing protein [Anaerolineae bacterium]